MDELRISHAVALRRQWPYWNWVVWEQVTAPWRETAILDEGLTLRRATALRKANELVAARERLWA